MQNAQIFDYEKRSIWAFKRNYIQITGIDDTEGYTLQRFLSSLPKIFISQFQKTG